MSATTQQTPTTLASPLIVSVSGVRGIVGESLTPTVVSEFASAYGMGRAGQTVVVCRDGRSTGPMLRQAVIAGLLSVGCKVVDLDVAPTPTCGFYIKSTGAGGGIQITASHNPPPYNGLKLFRPQGFVVGPVEGQHVADVYQQKQFHYVPWNEIQTVQTADDVFAPHLEAILPLIDVDAIRAKKFHTVMDANHGSGAIFGRRLLEYLGCTVSIFGETPDGQFDHAPEPIAENLVSLCDAVKTAGAQVGFATDPDADRLALVDNLGRYIGEELTLALCLLHRTTQVQGPVVLNGSTSLVSEETARQAGCKVYRSKVGEVHVAELMQQHDAIMGGEGNGGVIDPRVGYGRDSALAMALVLDLLAARDEKLSELADAMPPFFIHKEKRQIDRAKLPDALNELAQTFDGTVNTEDGVRVNWSDKWVQVRASNTEPIVRIFAEAREAKGAQALCQQAQGVLDKFFQ